MKSFIVYPKKGKVILLGFLSFLFVVAGIGVLYFAAANNEDAWPLWVIGVLAIVFFGLCIVYYFYTLFNRKPALIVDHEGIQDNSSYLAAGMVRWDEIEEIKWVSFQKQIFLGLITYDRSLITNRSTGLKKILNKINKSMLDSQVNITIQILDCSPEQLVDEINARRPQPNI
jgi:hypothetical protein